MTMLPLNDADTATRGIEAIHGIVKERDELRTTNDRLTVDISLFRERVDQLSSRLALALAERDHYMRHSVALVSRLSDIQMMINSCLEEASRAAYRPSSVPLPKTEGVPDVDIEKLRKIIEKLPTEQPSHD